MNYRNVTFDQLTDAEIAAWSAIQQSHPAYWSPNFRPEFTELVASVRPDVEVAVLEEAGAPVGFFPFQRTLLNAGQPVGSGMCDFQGLVALPEVECDPRQLLRACRLSSWRFDHLVPVHPSFDRYAWSSADSPYIDIPEGFDTYLQSRDNGKSIMAEYRQKTRKIERQFGPLRYEPHVSDPRVLATCIEWKIAQLRRTRTVNIFKYRWTVELLHRILAFHGEHFQPQMSVWYAGDQTAAIVFGIRSGRVLQLWFPAYNVEMRHHSPGFLQHIEAIRAAESLGISRIVLGRGEEEYKRRLMSGADRVLQGCVDMNPAVAAVRRTWRRTREAIKASPLQRPARVPARIVSRITTWLVFR